MLLIQQAIVARCLLVVALGGAGDSNSGDGGVGGGDSGRGGGGGGGGRGEGRRGGPRAGAAGHKDDGGVFGGGIAPRTQVKREINECRDPWQLNIFTWGRSLF